MISPPLLDNAATIYPPGIYPGAWLDENGEIVTDESGEPILLGPDNYGDIEPPLVGAGPAPLAPEVSGGQSAVIVSATIGLARGTMTIGCAPRSLTWS